MGGLTPQSGVAHPKPHPAPHERAWGAATVWADGIADADPSLAADWYQLGDGWLGVASADETFRSRFASLLSECRGAPAGLGPRVTCSVRTFASHPAALIDFADPEPLDAAAFALALFGDRGCVECPANLGAWRLLESDGFDPVAVKGTRLLAHRAGRWQAFAANLAINRVLRLQQEIAFFHAASVGIGGRGTLLVGAKGVGKTTLSLGLAARGHAFFGDEIAAVRLEGPEIIPFRRAAAVRDGPATAAVAAVMRRRHDRPDQYPDGTLRRRVSVARLFPAATAPAGLPLHCAVFVSGRAAQPRLTAIKTEAGLLTRLTPLASALWDVPPAMRAMRLLRLLADLQCYELEAGEPDATIDVLEQLGATT